MLLSLFFLHYPNLRICKERIKDGLNAHTPRWRYGLSVKPLCLSASFCLGQNRSWFILISQTPPQLSWSQGPPKRCTWTCLLSIMPPRQLTQHFRWGNAYLGNICTSCYDTHATYVVFPLGIILFTLPLYNLLCHIPP